MERIRLGNNIAISWALYELNGRVHSLEDKDVQLYMSCGGLKQAVTDYTIQGNVVSWVFLGTEQKKVGLYKLIIVERDELSGAQAVDVAEAFRIVSETFSAVETGEVTKNVSVRSVLTYSNLVGVESVDVVESSEDGGTNLVSIRLVDGNVVEIPIKNGTKGDKGDKGATGATGPKGDKGDAGERGPAGVATVAVSVDSEVGTPSAEVTKVGDALSIAFHNLKGDQGDPAVGIENYVTVEATPSTTAAADVLPPTGSADTLYRVARWDGARYDTTVYSVYGWYDGAYKFLEKKEVGIDDEPTANSQNLVKSGGVAAKISQLSREVTELEVSVLGNTLTVDTSAIEQSSSWSPSDVYSGEESLLLSPGNYTLEFLKGTLALDSSVSGASLQIVKCTDGVTSELINSMSSPVDKTLSLTVNVQTYVWMRAKGYLSGSATLSVKKIGALNDVAVKIISQNFTDSEKKIARGNVDAKNISIQNGLISIEEKGEAPVILPVSAYADNTSEKYYRLFGILFGGVKYVVDIVSDTAASSLSLFTATDASSTYRVDTISELTDIQIGHNCFPFTPSEDLIGGFINVNSNDLVSATVTVQIYYVDAHKIESPIGKYTFENRSFNELKAMVWRKKQTNIEPCIKFKKNIGDTFYMHLRVKFPTDVHEEHTPMEERTIFSISNGTNIFTAKLKKEKTTLPSGSEASSASQLPVPQYNGGLFAIKDSEEPTGKNSLVPDGWNKIFLLGEDAMSIRFKGDCSIGTNQDIRVKIDDTAITIFHNNTQSVIASYAKADYVAPDYDSSVSYVRGDTCMHNGDRYECCVDVATAGTWLSTEWFRKSEIAAIYEDMLADTEEGGDLDDFEVNWYNVARLSYDDLIRCEVRLVGLYKRYNPGDSPMNPTATAYDSFPFYFATKEKDRIYDIELALNKNATWAKSQLIIDGYGIEFGHYYSAELFNKECVITIGDKSSAHTLRNPEIIDFEINDTIDFKYPNLRVYYAESVQPGIADDLSSYYTAESRICELDDYLKQHDYGYVKLEELIAYLNGGLKLDAKNVFHFTHDDTGVDFFTQQGFDRLVQTYLRHNIIPSYATITNDDYSSVSEKIESLQKIGYFFYIHTFSSNDLATKSTGYISYDELTSGIEATRAMYMDKFKTFPIVWSFHQSGQNYNVIKALISRGFQILFGSSYNGSCNKITRYRVQRAPFRNESNLGAQIYKHIDNYIVENIT